MWVVDKYKFIVGQTFTKLLYSKDGVEVIEYMKALKMETSFMTGKSDGDDVFKLES